mgnify:CR=1 FL=1
MLNITSNALDAVEGKEQPHVIIETAFSNKERQLAEVSRHLCPSMLHEELVLSADESLARVRAAGLPEFLAARLGEGR